MAVEGSLGTRDPNNWNLDIASSAADTSPVSSIGSDRTERTCRKAQFDASPIAADPVSCEKEIRNWRLRFGFRA
jgi:hypothetical protein